MAYDGSILIDAKIFTKGANAQLMSLENRIAKSSQKAASLKKRLNSLEQAKIPTSEYENLQKEIDSVNAVVEKGRKELEKNGYTGEMLAKTLSEAFSKEYSEISRIQQKMRELEQSGKAFSSGKETQEYSSLAAQYAMAERDLQALLLRHDELISKQGQSNSVFAKMRSTIKSLVNHAKNFLKTLVSANKSVLSFGKSSKTSFGGNAIKNILKYAFGIRSLYFLFNKLRTAAKEGLNNLVQFSDDANGSMSNLKSALTQLKNAFATAFTPILQMVEPALTRLINLLSQAFTAIARLIAAMTGKSTFVQAVKVQEDYAASLDGTASSAKKASGALASFDTLEVLNKDDSSGGGSSTNPKDMFETVSVEPLEFDSWGEAFDAFLDYLLNTGVPKLQESLLKMADWINGFSANVYEMFTFPGVEEKVSTLGTRISDAFNNLVSAIDWSVLGGALGAGVNSAVNFLVSLIYGFNWFAFGNSVAVSINRAITEIDWYKVGQLLLTGIKVAFMFLAGLITGLDMKTVGDALSQAIIGFVDSITETLNNADWEKIGDQLKELLVNIDWAGILSSLGRLAGALVASAIELIVGFFKDGAEWAKEKFTKNAEELGGNWVLGIFLGIGEAVVGIGTWIWENIAVPIIDGFKEAFDIHSPSGVMEGFGINIIEGLFNGIADSEMFQKIQDVFNGIIDFINGDFSLSWDSAWEGVKTGLGTVWEGIKTTVKNSINGIIGFVNGMIKAIVSGLNKAIDAINSISVDIPSWIPGVGGKHFGLNLSHITAPQIPFLANGAVIKGGNPFLAVLGDQRPGQTNVETPLDTMIQAFNLALDSRGSSSGPLQVNLIVNGERFAQATLRDFENEINRQGGLNIDLSGGLA